jgi:Transposase and inactivated derivatives
VNPELVVVLPDTWPDTAIQRCIFHLQLNVTRELTRNPRLKAGRPLHQIALNLTDAHNLDAAIAWWQRFAHA